MRQPSGTARRRPKKTVRVPWFPLRFGRRNVMDKKVSEASGLVDEFSKFARETADYLQERAGELEENMTKVMGESGKAFGMKFSEKFGEGSKLGDYIEKNPSKAAMFAFMAGTMLNRKMKSSGVNPNCETDPEMKSGETSKPKMTAKRKAA
jgi:hypothetical protein